MRLPCPSSLSVQPTKRLLGVLANGGVLAFLAHGLQGFLRFGFSGIVSFSVRSRHAYDRRGRFVAHGFIVDGEFDGGELGYRVYSAGDMNGDGIDDFVISAPFFQISTDLPGSIYVIYGGTDLHHDGVFDVAAITNDVVGEGDGTLGFRFTGSVATCCEFVGFYGLAGVGDVNGDGYDDIAVSALTDGGGFPYSGRIYLIFGGHGETIGNSLDASTIINGDGTLGVAITGGTPDYAYLGDYSEYLGRGIAPLGDVNGDGFADFSAAAPYSYVFGEGQGRPYVIFGGDHLGDSAVVSAGDVGSVSLPGLILEAETGIFELGWHAGGAGDVNGDGYADVVIGVPAANLGGSERGRVYVVFGGPNVDDLSPLNLADISGGDGTLGFVVDGAVNSEEVGAWVSGRGDVNGDGFDDLLITGDSLSNNDDGAIYIIYGGDGLNHGGSLTVDTLTNGVAGEGDGTLGYIIEAAEALDAFGYAAEFVGDINGDGLADFIVGARGATAANNGRAYVIFGNEDAPPGAILDLATDITGGDGSLGFFLDGEVSGDGLGTSVAGAGDVNGDGWPDLIVGASGYSTDLGRVYVIFGPF